MVGTEGKAFVRNLKGEAAVTLKSAFWEEKSKADGEENSSPKKNPVEVSALAGIQAVSSPDVRARRPRRGGKRKVLDFQM